MFSLSNSHKLRREFQCAGKSNLVEGVMMETCSFDDGDETRNWYYDKVGFIISPSGVQCKHLILFKTNVIYIHLFANYYLEMIL